MKPLYVLTSLVIVIFYGLSSCSTLFDVGPKAVYSPIELNASLNPIKLSESTCQVSFIGNDASLKYGALVFYDSSAAASFIRERTLIGSVQSVLAVNNATITNGMSATVTYDNTKGQFLYVAPIAYKPDDSLPILTNQDYQNVFSSKGYMQLKISPWTHITNLPQSTGQSAVKLFNSKGLLGCIINNPAKITGYRFDSTKNNINQSGWIAFGTTINKICNGLCTLNTQGLVTAIHDVYESASGMTFVVKAYFPTTKISYNTIGVITTGPDLSITNYQSTTAQAYKIDNNFVDVLTSKLLPSGNIETIFIQAKKESFLDYQFPYSFDLAYYNASVSPQIFNYNASLKTITYIAKKTTIKPYNIGLTINDNFITNSDGSFQNFGTFSGSGDKITYTILSAYDINFGALNIYMPAKPYGMLPCITGDNEGYLILANQNIIRLSIIDNKIKSESLFSNWFPGGTPKSITQGVYIDKKIFTLVNGFEIWQFDPSQVKIDFTRNGAFVIVPL